MIQQFQWIFRAVRSSTVLMLLIRLLCIITCVFILVYYSITTIMMMLNDNINVKVASSSSPSSVEEALLDKSIYTKDMYSLMEKTRTFIVDSFPLLGKVVAYRFIEWVIGNPEGVCALPTGKTPEYFIKWTQRIVNEWDTPAIKDDRRLYGMDGSIPPPRFDKLWFVMLDEFYPMNPEHHNSFKYYVSNYYIEGLGFNPDRCLFIDLSKLGLRPNESLDDIWPDGTFVDLSLRLRTPNTPLEVRQQDMIRQVDQWCLQYESKIRELGGIGFFLGGIGPDGHIAFNIRGSDHRSTTRLAQLNYETQAAASGDLGGIRAVKAKCAVTIAAGEAKASMVADGIQKDTNVMYPSHAIRVLPNAAFYITRGAAKMLTQRKIIDLEKAPNVGIEDIENILVDVAVKSHKRLVDLSVVDVTNDPVGKVLIDRMGWGDEDDFHHACSMITDRLVSKIGRGTETIHDTTFLHTEPHHDDIMLGYLPSVIRQTRPTSNKHYFICATSGFNSVSNYHIRHMIARAEKFISTNSFAKLVGEGYFLPKPYDGDDDGLTSPAMTSSANFVDINTPPPPPAVTTTTTDPAREHYQLTRSRDVWQYLDGVAAKDENEKAEGSARRFIRNIIEIYGLSHSRDLHGQVEDKLHHLDDYLNTVYPGQADTRDVQILKGSCREFESECAWGSLGWLPSHVAHMRLGFYTSDIFTPDPTLERDSKPVIHVLLRTQPDIVTVAFDPEASGPDTHYKVLQAVTEALKVYQRTRPDKPIKVWGYRNVWYRFDTSEVTHIVPSSLSSLGSLDRMFMTNFESQTSAEFPSYELDGPFSKLAARIQVEQYKNLKVCLGRRWFQEHTSALIRATKGLVYFKEMTVPELEKFSRALRSRAEQY